MPDYEITLDGFEFPANLPNGRANFRFVVDLRYRGIRGALNSETVVMPGLDTWWECDTGKAHKPNYVRADGKPRFDVERIDPWDRLVLRFRASELYRMQVKVFDVDRPDFWDTVSEALSRIVQGLFGTLGEEVRGVPLVGDSLGSLAEDIRSTAARLLAGGDRVLFKGSAPMAGEGETILIRGSGSANKDRPGSYTIRFRRRVLGEG